MSRRPKILFITRHTPLPWDDGAGAYAYSLLEFLSRNGFAINVAWLNPHTHLCWQGVWALPPDYARALRLYTPGAVRVGRRLVYPDIYWLPFKARMLGRIRESFWLPPRANPPPSAPANLAPPTQRPWTDTPNAEEARYAHELTRKLKPAIIIANYPWLTPILPACTSAHHVCLHHDIAWKRSLQQSLMAGTPPEVTAETEARWLQNVDTVIDISSEDRDETRRICPRQDVVLARKAVTLSSLPPAKNQRLLFVGSNNGFNVAGLSWFFEQVWPALRAELPEITLDVCGNINGAVTARPAGVNFRGQVPDVLEFYRDAAVVIVPLLQATGLNIKLVDAAACCRPIVTTSVTIQGAPFLRDAVVIADTPDKYGQEVARLLRQPAEAEFLAKRAYDAVRTHLAPETSYAEVLAKFRRVTAARV